MKPLSLQDLHQVAGDPFRWYTTAELLDSFDEYCSHCGAVIDAREEPIAVWRSTDGRSTTDGGGVTHQALFHVACARVLMDAGVLRFEGPDGRPIDSAAVEAGMFAREHRTE